MLTPVNCEIRNSILNVSDETYNSKHLENSIKILVIKLRVSAEMRLRQIGPPPPVPMNHFINHLETRHTFSGGAILTFHS